MEYNGNEREYFIWLPKNYNEAQTYWGLVVAHGGNNNGRGFWLAKHIREAADSAGLQAIVISPTFLPDDPNAERFPILGEGAFLKLILREVQSNYNIKSKILLTGYSRGGHFSHRFALWNPTLVEACAPLAAGAWTTPDGRFLHYAVGEVKDPQSYFSNLENRESMPEKHKNLFDPRVAKVAGRKASPGADKIPFLVMCGTLDERYEAAREFASILKEMEYKVDTLWPQTPHGGASKDKYRVEFKKYSREVVKFFLRVTEGI